jgi:hypothetical protein
MAYQEFGCFVEMAALQAAAFFLDIAELLESLLELTGEARAVEPEGGEERDLGLRVGGLGEQFGLEEWDAVEAPGGVGDFVDQLSLGGVGGGVLIEALLDVALVCRGVLSGQECGAGSETVAQRVCDERCLPVSVRGPVECAELARLVAARAFE